MLFKKQTIQSDLTKEEFLERLATTDCFEGFVADDRFEVREEKSFSNKLLFPVVNGEMINQENTTMATVLCAMRKVDKIGIGGFLLFTAILSVVLGVVSHDVLLWLGVFLWDVVLAVFFAVVYAYNCRRALRKILKITNSKCK